MENPDWYTGSDPTGRVAAGIESVIERMDARTADESDTDLLQKLLSLEQEPNWRCFLQGLVGTIFYDIENIDQARTHLAESVTGYKAYLQTFDEVLNTLQDELREQFKADAVEMKLFASEQLDAPHVIAGVERNHPLVPMLMEGLDDIGLTMEKAAAIDGFGQQAPYIQTFPANQVPPEGFSRPTGLDFLSPVGIVEHPAGGYLVVDADIGAIFVLSPDGRPLGRFTTDELLRPTGMDIDELTGNIYVADKDASHVKVYSLDDVNDELLDIMDRAVTLDGIAPQRVR